MKIVIFTHMPQGLYSGGRYLALILAHSLNRVGVDVTYVANNHALFDSDFEFYERSKPLSRIINADFEVPDDMPADWVVVIPTGGFNGKFYNAALRAAEKWNARVALLNFETPNWFNSLSPFARSPMPTESWRQVISRSGAVISITNEGISPAREFFGRSREDLAFDYWHPPINDLVADSVSSIPDGRRRVVSFVRTEDQHKGAHDLLKIDPSSLDGCTLSLVFGRGINQRYTNALARHFGQASDVELELHEKITDAEKFSLLESASLLLFPSYFEGFGYPPVEAAYMGVPSVAYDLPLLRETVPASTGFVPLGDTTAFNSEICRLLIEAPDRNTVRSQLAVAPDTLTAGRKFVEVLGRAEAKVTPRSPMPPENIRVPAPYATVTELQATNVLSAVAGDLLIGGLQITAQGNLLAVRGRVSGDLSNLRLRFILPGATIPDLHLKDPNLDTKEFSLPGSFETWPEDQLHQHCRIFVIERHGRLVLKTESIVTISPELLFQRKIRHIGEPTTRAVIVADASALYRNALGALSLGAITKALGDLGVATELLLLDHPTTIPKTCDPDLLPLADTVICSDMVSARNRLHSVIMEDGIGIVATSGTGEQVDLPGRVPGVSLGSTTYPLVLGAKKLPNGLADAVNAILTPRTLYESRRSVIRQSSGAVMVMAPSAPISSDALPEPLENLLSQIGALVPDLNVIVPERLYASPDQPPLFYGAVNPVTLLREKELKQTIENARKVVVLQWGGQERDVLLRGVLESARKDSEWIDLGSSWHTLDHAALKANCEDVFNGFSQKSEHPLCAALSNIVPKKTALDKQWPDIDPTYFPLLKNLTVLPAPDAPTLTRVNNLCFTGPVADSRSALRLGWGSMSETGSRMKAGGGVIAFFVPAEERREGSTLEVLVAVRKVEQDGATVSLVMNRGEPKIEKFESNQHKVIEMPLAAAHWQGEDTEPQYLGVNASGGAQVSLLSIAISDPKPDEIDWDEYQPDAAATAHVTKALPKAFEVNAEGPSKGLSLRTGWHLPETSGCWGGGSAAALGFDGPIQSKGPVIIKLRGHGFSPASLHPLAVGLAYGTHKFAELIPVGNLSSEYAIGLPADICQEKIDTLFLEFSHSITPSSLSASEDTRSLAFHLEGLSLEYTGSSPLEVHELDETQGNFDGARLRLGASQGVLEVSGPGDVPAGIVFGFVNSHVLAYPQPMGNEGWSASIAIPSVGPHTEIIDFFALSIADDGRIHPLPPMSSIALWAEGASETPGVTLALHYTSGETLQTDKAGRFHRPSNGVNFAVPEQPKSMLGKGWSDSGDHVWSIGAQASLPIQLGDGPNHRLCVLHASAFLSETHTYQRVEFALGHEAPIATMIMSETSPARFVIPLSPESGPVLVPTFRFPDRRSPAEAGLSADDRSLGINLLALHAEALTPEQRDVTVTYADDVTPGILHFLGSAAAGGILRLYGFGKPPAGLFLRETPEVIMTPIPEPHDDRWFVDLVVSSTKSDQDWQVLTCSVPPSEHLVIPVRGRVFCTFSFLVEPVGNKT